MALLIWLPLNDGTLNNKGVGNYTFVNDNTNTLTVTTGGKLGNNCYQRATAKTAGRIYSNENLNLKEDFSMTCWCYITAIAQSDSANGIITNHDHNTSTGCGINIKYINASDFRISCSTGTGSGRTFMDYYGTTNIYGKWHHLGLTYSYSNKQLKLWVDGEVDYTLNNYSNASADNKFMLFDWSTGHNDAGYRPALKLNDVRVYDHCLSIKEMKELAKGLVLHYKLDNKGLGQPNILYKSGVEVTNKNYQVQSYEVDTQMVAGNKYTCTICFTPASDMSYLALYLSGGYAHIVTLPKNGNEKQIVTRTFTCSYYSGRTPSESASYANPTFYRFPNPSGVNNPADCTIHWVKIEAGEKATPWYLGSYDPLYLLLESNKAIETDCSGHGYNGTITGNLMPSADTPKYNCSSIIGTTSTKVIPPAIDMYGFTNTYTITWWEYFSSTSNIMPWGFGNGNRLNLYHNSNLYWNTGDGTNNPFSPNITVSSIINQWNHIAITGDGATTKLYINGAYIASAKTYKALTGTQLYLSGWDTSIDYSWNGGKLSDFRIYATALSADDISNLYKTSASIDRNGNIFTSSLEEEII